MSMKRWASARSTGCWTTRSCSRSYWNKVVQKTAQELKQYDSSKEMKDLTSKVLIDLSKERLNKLVVNAVMHEADREVSKAKKKVQEENEWGRIIKYNRDEIIHIASPDFMREFRALVNEYISIKETTHIKMAEKKYFDENELRSILN